MSDTIPGIAPSPVSAVDLDAIEEWARGSTIMAARARIPAIVRELREAREELARLRERDAASATDDPLSSIKTMQIALRARPLDHDTLALLLVLKGAREEIERLRALLPPFVAAHNPDRAQIALLGASRPGAGLVGLAYTIGTVSPDVDAAPPAAQETKS